MKKSIITALAITAFASTSIAQAEVKTEQGIQYTPFV